uniref:Uncharacterized protein n=1 Tax=Arundo donax TaxID=35708 RepID=A0A0A9C7J7_ARUDO
MVTGKPERRCSLLTMRSERQYPSREHCCNYKPTNMGTLSRSSQPQR